MTKRPLPESLFLRRLSWMGRRLTTGPESLRTTTRYRYKKAHWSARKARRFKSNVLALGELGKNHLVGPDGSIYFRSHSGDLVLV